MLKLSLLMGAGAGASASAVDLAVGAGSLADAGACPRSHLMQVLVLGACFRFACC